MNIKRPKYQSENSEKATFCVDCGTKFISPKGIDATETLEKPLGELTQGTTLANRYEIIGELGKDGMEKVYRVEDIKISEEVDFKSTNLKSPLIKGPSITFKLSLNWII